jgi:hypothetical protein
MSKEKRNINFPRKIDPAGGCAGSVVGGAGSGMDGA